MIYLDYAATSFKKPTAVYQAVYNAMVLHSANPGRGGHTPSVQAASLVYETREKLCQLFGINRPERLAFYPNTTAALNAGIKGVVGPGDHVVVSSMEHNSVLRPLETLKRQGFITYTLVQADSNGRLNPHDFDKAVNNRTRLVICTHASNVCGNVYDIKEISRIAHKKGAYSMIDAAQGAGTLPICAEDFDLLAFPGHKGLYGPQGSGGLFVGDDIHLKTITEGGTGSQSELLTQPNEMPDRLESGTLNVPAIAGLGAAADFILTEGIETIRQHEKNLLHYFIQEIQNINGITLYGDGSSINTAAINIEGMDCVQVAEKLNTDYDIAVRSGLHCAATAHKSLGTLSSGSVRFSIGYFTNKKQIDTAIHALHQISKQK
ncbi:MAG: aminotransferase class V-fold PLP-dependent enzyme [Ruminococcaceae bacterium]|nr:aminotransferase class V-fold PLP-dependent enzyme [Oscillospiraceae bacterium]